MNDNLARGQRSRGVHMSVMGDSPSPGSRQHRRRGHEGDSRGEQPGGKMRLELTEEEKSVLLECRKNSIARGIILGASSVILLRQLVKTGRVTTHIQRWSMAYYSSVGALAFIFGSASYKQRCIDKLMALEHSVLADQLRQHRRKLQGWSDEGVPGSSSPQPPSTTLPLPQPSTHTYPPYSEGETVPSDKPFSTAAHEQDFSSQPDAFGTDSDRLGGVQDQYLAPPTRTRGRTFDEIREENRRRQLQQYHPPASSGVRREDTGKTVRVRRNKYGDIVSDD